MLVSLRDGIWAVAGSRSIRGFASPPFFLIAAYGCGPAPRSVDRAADVGSAGGPADEASGGRLLTDGAAPAGVLTWRRCVNPRSIRPHRPDRSRANHRGPVPRPRA